MRDFRACSVFLLFVAFGGVSQTAEAQTVTDERLWFTLNLQDQGTPDSPWRWSVETLIRSREGVSEFDTFSIRPVVTYVFNKRSSVAGGYAFGGSLPTTGGVTIEQRVFAHYVFTSPVGGGTFSWRTRVEARVIEGNSGPLGRLREHVRYSRPIKTGSTVSLLFYDEFFYHLNDTTRSPRGIDQNRVFAGLSHAVGSAARYELGYLHVFSPGHRGAADRRYHVLSANLAILF